VPRDPGRGPLLAAGETGRRADPAAGGAQPERRRASRSLWAACEALLGASAEPRAVNRALDALCEAFECDGVALHALGPSGEIEPWCARGIWRNAPGDLRHCVTVPLLHGQERVGKLDLMGRPGQRWRPSQIGLVRTASGALGAALGSRLELERLRHQPGRDPVTGLPDARALQIRLGEELARARRHGLPLSVVMVDIDHFAAVNSRYGRTVGDAALAEAALLLKLTLRESDVLARLGGDRFGIVLPETEVPAALRCAERVRRAIEEHAFARIGRLSASAGLASSPRDGLEAVELMSRLDQALAIAKKSGRRRVGLTEQAHTH
jgi:diguanylate cyclase (GGDEF)-like protein